MPDKDTITIQLTQTDVAALITASASVLMVAASAPEDERVETEPLIIAVQSLLKKVQTAIAEQKGDNVA